MKTLSTLFLLCLLNAAIGQNNNNGNAVKYISSDMSETNCTGEIKFDPAIHKNSNAPIGDMFPSFAWPLEEDLNDGIVLVNYIDNTSGSAITDYMGNSWSYNGHNGTDLCLHSFRDMDRFVAVKAAANGTVEQIRFNQFDRNTSCTGTANIVLIRHDDGTYAYYYHLMRNSVQVRVGEYVLAGKILGWVGSSGCSTDAHLHFECGSFVNGTWVKRDPWHGTYNTLPSLWASQEPYAGNTDFRVHDMGVYANASVAGDVDEVTIAELKERVIDPVTISGYEPQIGIWVLAQGLQGNSFQFEVRKPNGSLYTSTSAYLYDNAQYGWWYWTPNFNVGVSETGNWYARIVEDGIEQMRVYFNVQLLTSIRPRLYPEAARCFRRSIFVQKDTLRVRPVRSNMEYELVNAPPGVTLTNDSIITISSFSQIFRVQEFKVIASINGSSSLRDTMIYKLIDTTKNHPSGNGIVSLELNATLEGMWNGSTMVSDTVTVLLRNALSPYTVIDADVVKLNSNGFAIANFPDASSGIYYYIVVKHRNSIETWSSSAHSFPNGYPYDYDFSTSYGQAYGNNLKYKSGEYCIYSGDPNNDQFVDAADIIKIYNDLTAITFGYVDTDLDGDDFVDSADLLIAYNNARNLVGRERP